MTEHPASCGNAVRHGWAVKDFLPLLFSYAARYRLLLPRRRRNVPLQQANGFAVAATAGRAGIAVASRAANGGSGESRGVAVRDFVRAKWLGGTGWAVVSLDAMIIAIDAARTDQRPLPGGSYPRPSTILINSCRCCLP